MGESRYMNHTAAHGALSQSLVTPQIHYLLNALQSGHIAVTAQMLQAEDNVINELKHVEIVNKKCNTSQRANRNVSVPVALTIAPAMNLGDMNRYNNDACNLPCRPGKTNKSERRAWRATLETELV